MAIRRRAESVQPYHTLPVDEPFGSTMTSQISKRPNSSIADVSWFSIARHVLAQFIERRTREAHSDGLVQGRRFFERTDKVIHLARNQLFDRTVGIVPLARMLCGETQRLSALGQC